MANFGSFGLTEAGRAVQTKAQGGKTLNFTKFEVGKGDYTGSISSLTQLVDKVMNVNIARNVISASGSNKKVTIGFNLNTADVSTGFYMKEIGLYVEEPDTHENVLMFYGNAGSTADYIPAGGGGTISEKIVDLEINISNVSTITAIIDSSLTYATISQLNTVNNAVTLNTNARHTHSNKALLDTYTQTEADIADAVSKKHSHSNKSILDATTASFTTSDKTKVDNAIQEPATDGTNGQLLTTDGNGGRSWTTVRSGGTWGSIQGTLSNQTDLNNALTNKVGNAANTIIAIRNVWYGTQAQYTSLGTYDTNTLYFIFEG